MFPVAVPNITFCPREVWNTCRQPVEDEEDIDGFEFSFTEGPVTSARNVSDGDEVVALSSFQ